MAEVNGKNKWIFWLTGTLVTIIVFISLPTMAKAIIDNDRRNTDQHIGIKAEMIERDEKITEKMESVKDIVTDIRIEQREQMTILRSIAR